MVIRPSVLTNVLVTAIALGVPASARNGNSLLRTALEHGTGSRQMLALLGSWSLVAIWGFLAVIRSRTTLHAAPGLPLVLVVQGAFRRRSFDLAHVRQVRLVTLSSGSTTRQVAVLLDVGGRVVATPPYHRGIWTRDDAVALLRTVDVTVAYEHRLSSPAEVEAAYPGSTTWGDRHPRATLALVGAAVVPAVLGLVWYFDLG